DGLLDLQPPGGVELPGGEVRRAAGSPDGFGYSLELQEELHGRQPAPDDEGAQPSEVLLACVVLRMQLVTAECLDAGDVRHVRVIPRAGGAEEDVRGGRGTCGVRAGGGDGELLARRLHAGDVCGAGDRKSTRLNSSHVSSSYAVFCLTKEKI